MVTDIARSLSPAARSVWAKSHRDPVTGAVETWLPLYQHLADTAEIAKLLWDDWLSPAVKRTIEEAVGDPGAARTLAVWLAATHDLGKASPAFAFQVPALAARMERAGLRGDPSIMGEDRSRCRHEVVSHVTVADWLQHHGFTEAQADRLGSVLAAHHGLPQDHAAVRAARSQSRFIGDVHWAHTRVELLEAMTELYAHSEALGMWRSASLPLTVLVPLSGFVIVADWLASSDRFEPVLPGTEPAESARERALRAWEGLDLPRPWSPHPPQDNAELFARRFGLGSGVRARPVQETMMTAARETAGSALMILEAPMGVGKTEAALAAAEILAERLDRSGVFFGLPTQATADALFGRTLQWAERLGLDTPSNIHLAHGKSGQNDRFDRMQWEARFRAIGESDDRRARALRELVIAHHWFASPKRGPLSNFVVGTIDQALFGALRSKHLMLRHLALAGKVVILDEVHAYDAYMSQFLERVLHWLGAYDVPVIMLSATLPAERRIAFVEAYVGGASSRTRRQPQRRSWTERRDGTPADSATPLRGDIGYPSIVVADGRGTPRVLTPEAGDTARQLKLERMDDTLEALEACLRGALADGGTAVVIRNTVSRVQETAAHLRRVFGAEKVIVAHARFLARDRAERDRRLLELFGKNGRRPDQMIVVASQVVEQSLDVDFDIMISDVAPIDLILQRAGRLHRHDRVGRPALVREPRLVLTGVHWNAVPPEPHRGSQKIYSRYVLLRTLASLHGRDTLHLPADIPHLVQTVYGEEPQGPDEWQTAIAAARTEFDARRAEQQGKAQGYLLPPVMPEKDLLGWVAGSAGDPETEALAQGTVRDGEETLEVLVLQRRGDDLYTPTWLSKGGGQLIPQNEPPSHALTKVILGCSLRLPAAVCRGRLADRHIAHLEERYPVQAWHGSHALRGELVLVLDEDRRAWLDPFVLTYSPEDGLSYEEVSDGTEAESEQAL
ncbi:CRISPR-associated helicase Cas3' [Microbacterium album]|uniref:CRISPR-associated helicase/endonuclease Cas3 n=1 Tax=Microbacterium album TaxID=2053191 RepID=A0A917MP34_9MICO|nr:CRISPR-associated helicase Cas3' [Microbacterium album]GGH51498.1 CRISPR-associated helicase/endonuclease Cas3 [Microbacterium album]